MIFTIFKKELKETLRDRRTILMMIVIPVLLIPVILNVSVGIMSSVEKEASAKELRIGIIGNKNCFVGKELAAIPATFGKKKISYYPDEASLQKDLQKDSLDLGVMEDALLKDKFSKKTPATILWYFKGTEMGMEERAKGYMQYLENKT